MQALRHTVKIGGDYATDASKKNHQLMMTFVCIAVLFFISLTSIFHISFYPRYQLLQLPIYHLHKNI